MKIHSLELNELQFFYFTNVITMFPNSDRMTVRVVKTTRSFAAFVCVCIKLGVIIGFYSSHQLVSSVVETTIEKLEYGV